MAASADSSLSGSAADRLLRLTTYSPAFAHLVEQHPDYHQWVEAEANRDTNYLYSAFLDCWEEYRATINIEDRSQFQEALQRFRKKMDFRIAYRDVNNLATVETSLAESTLLAEFCLQTALEWCLDAWSKRLGVPWNDSANQPAKICILGLGKLGGGELNFCSDLDLIFFFDADGHCRRGERKTNLSTVEFYNRMLRDLCKLLNERSAAGYVYNIDLRLRPEGDSGPAIRTFNSMVNYYWAAGQIWERLALIRARPVAGNRSLGEELLEELNPFRYPRATSPGLLQEVAGVKVRTEREVVGSERLRRDIKSGYGGIREVEFHVQALQLLQGGRNPFLQSSGTFDAIERLERYGIIDEADAHFLSRAYRILRQIENRLQIYADEPTHELPESPGRLDGLAASFGETREVFMDRLGKLRDGVRSRYSELFSESSREKELQDWTLFLGGREPATEIAEDLERWFDSVDDRDERIRNFVLGPSRHLVTREQVNLFLDISSAFDALLPRLARPLTAMERVSDFAASYGARKQFFKACLQNPRLFEILAVLFDRSGFIAAVLKRHPEIMEEVIHQAAARDKTHADYMEELQLLGDNERFPHLLWLYIKAEQIRLSIAELLFEVPPQQVETGLTTLADAAVGLVASRVDPEGELAFIGAGKLGSGEMTIGSDLDLIIFGPPDSDGSLARKVRNFLRVFEYRTDLGKTFDIDLRLRPHGQDGPLTVTVSAFSDYHVSGRAGMWERLLLTRTRLIAGSPTVAEEFMVARDSILAKNPLPANHRAEIWAMRQKIEAVKTASGDPFLAYKAGPGGLVDIEFLAQTATLESAVETGAIDLGSTRQLLAQVASRGILPEAQCATLQDTYDYLRLLERCLRRDNFSECQSIGGSAEDQYALARWLGYQSVEEMRETLEPLRRKTRKIVETFFAFDGLQG